MSIDENNPTNTTTAQPTAAEPAPVTAPSAAVPSEPTQAAPTDGGGAVDGGGTTEQPRPRRRGFAAMDRDRVKEIASKGGRAAHAAGTAHQFSADEARVAGKKGGLAPHVRRGGVRRRPTQASEAAAPQSRSGLNGGQH